MLAIVIPFYNIDFFEETLYSLSKQTNKEFNLYIGNDASQSDPFNLISSFEKSLNVKYKKFNNNLGGTFLTQHWERCIEMVQEEEWIMILGDDDILDINVVEKWYSHRDIFVNSCNVVRFASQIINSAGVTASEIFSHPVWEKSSDSFVRKINNVTRSSLSEHIFRKSMYKKYGFKKYNLAWFSDDRAWLDFSESKPIYSINDSLVQIRVSDKSISGKENNKKIKIEASSQFFKSLIKEKQAIFDPRQRHQILFIYERIASKKGFVGFRNAIFLLNQYIKLKNFKVLKLFIKRFLKNYL